MKSPVFGRLSMPLIGLAFTLSPFLGACQREPAASPPAAQPPATSSAPAVSDGTVTVVATDYAFEAPQELPSGWTTFRLVNRGLQPHFLLTYRLPDGKTQSDLQAEVVPAYDQVMAARQKGEVDEAGALQLLAKLAPPWAFTMAYRGGPGLTAPGRESQATVNLDLPGTYMMECYVKSPDGKFHSSMGMQHEFHVTAARGAGAEPDADVDLTLANAGITTTGALTAGRHTIRVHYRDDPPGGFPYDVHLARLRADTDMKTVEQWMNWLNVGGLRSPAPADFMGGAENMPAGNTAYFTVDLEPGRYAWLSEVGAEDRMHQEFTVE